MIMRLAGVFGEINMSGAAATSMYTYIGDGLISYPFTKPNRTDSGTRTHKAFRPSDFKSDAFTISPCRHRMPGLTG